MQRSEAPRTQNTADTIFVLTVSRGLASPRTREFRAGEPQAAASVGTAGDWQLRGPGVEPVHAYLYFDGDAVYVQSALAGREVVVGGQRVGNDWLPMAISEVLEIGTTRLTLTQTNALGRTGASQIARAAEPPAPSIVIAQAGSHAVTGEELTAFIARPGLPLDDEDATRHPALRNALKPLSYGDDESTRMVSTDGRPASHTGPVAGDPYDDLQERTHAATAGSAISKGLLSDSVRVALEARGMVHPADRQAGPPPVRASQPPPPAPKLPPEQRSRPRVADVAYTPTGPVAASPPPAVVRLPPASLGEPASEPTPAPRANWSSQIVPQEGSRARAAGEILGAPPPRAAARLLTSASDEDLGEPGGETRVGPLHGEAQTRQARGLGGIKLPDRPSVVTPDVGPPQPNAFAPSAADETRRRQQKTARVRGQGSGGYTPPPPPMALPQAAPAKAAKPPSAIKRQLEAFAEHFEEVNQLRKILYLASPFMLLTALYILFAPEPPAPTPGPTQVVTPPSATPPPTPVVDAGLPASGPLARPDGSVQKVGGGVEIVDAGKPNGKAPKVAVVTLERKAADAFAAGKYDEAIALYQQLLVELQDEMNSAALGSPEHEVLARRVGAISEVLRILEERRAAGPHEKLQQADPLKSAR